MPYATLTSSYYPSSWRHALRIISKQHMLYLYAFAKFFLKARNPSTFSGKSKQ